MCRNNKKPLYAPESTYRGVFTGETPGCRKHPGAANIERKEEDQTSYLRPQPVMQAITYTKNRMVA